MSQLKMDTRGCGGHFPSITAKDILTLLENKHSADVFVPECKTGATQGYALSPEAIMRKLDAWVMKKSWANPLVIGYEIKTHRGDFLSDKKWQNYLDYCNEFYFVCPTNLIQRDELPAEAGLLWVSKTGTMLYTKKKAPNRINVEIPDQIYRYILMSRVRIINEHRQEKISKSAYWQYWLKEKRLDASLGYNVGKALAKTIEEKIDKIGRENETLKEENDRLQEVKELVKTLDLDVRGYYWKDRIQEKIEMINKGLPCKNLMRFLTGTIESLQEIQKIYNKK